MKFFLDVFQFVLDAGVSVMMPIIIIILSLIFGIKFNKAIRAGLMIGVGFIGINLVIGLMANTLGPATQALVTNIRVNLDVMDVGWPIGAAISFGQSNVVPWVFLVGIILNVIMLALNWTDTADIDMWNYWHFIFVASFVYVALRDAFGGTLALVIALALCAIGIAMTLKLADWTAPIVQKFFGLPGVSLPHMETVTWAPVGYAVNWVLERIPGVKNWKADPDTIQKKFGVFGEPMFIGTFLGLIISILAFFPEFSTDFRGALLKILTTAITLGAVMVILPRMVSLLMEGLLPLSEGAREFITKKFPGRKIHIGLDAAVALGHPANIATALLMVPVTIVLAVLMGVLGLNRILPFADLVVLPFHTIWAIGWSKGNIIRGVITGIFIVAGELFIGTQLAPYLTTMGSDIGFAMPEGARLISSLDVGAHLNGYLLALPWIKFLEGGWGRFVIFAIVSLILFALAILMIRKADVNAVVADLEEEF
jgi:PTS system galactitol-specific IIC component